MPIGRRPKPRVARDHSPKFNTDNTGRAKGVSRTKTPTGSRPVPKVARNTPVPPRPGNDGPPAAKTTKMPAPKQRWGMRGGGKPHGGK